MKKQKFSKSRIIFYVLLILAFFGYRYYQQQQDKSERKAKVESAINQNRAQQRAQEKAYQRRSSSAVEGPGSETTNSSGRIASIADLTDEEVVINYVRKHGELPDYYMTKKEARKRGWDPSKGNLCDVLPGKAIGGDYFGNYEKNLPDKKGRQYREADINYNCGNRNASRLVYSNDGLIYTTDDHYTSFTKR